MSFMFEVYYKAPSDDPRESRLVEEVMKRNGKLSCREEPRVGDASSAICLTYVFEDLLGAEAAAERLRQIGEHVEEIQSDYPDDED